MPFPFLGGFAERASRHLSTRRNRFNVALTSGFAIAGIVLANAAFDGSGYADDLFGSLGTMFGMQAPASSANAGTSRGYHRSARRLNRERVRLLPMVSHHGSANRSASRAESPGRPTRLGRISMCVRLCDGFAFPVGAYHGDADRAPHEATCRSECPGAETALYVMASGSETLDDAVALKTGRAYSQLPGSFHYTTLIDSSCSCHPAGGNKVSSLLHDFTLRRGDAVMTSHGVRVFHGSARFPYRRADFVPLSRSRDVRRADRQTFHAIERASLATGRTLAAAPAQPIAGTRDLEHQASR